MRKQVLITGGAGFIGSHLVDELLDHGYRVRVLDNLSEQVHGENSVGVDYLSPHAELCHGDVRNRDDVVRALQGVDAVYHLAAAVGVGQSMYEIRRYTDINNMGTATLLEALIEHPVQRLVVASSMSIYGEGLYRKPEPSHGASNGRMHRNGANNNGANNNGANYNGTHRNGTGQDGSAATVAGHQRSLEQLKRNQWELLDEAGEPLQPIPTPETKAPDLSSVYALSKYDQERMCLIFGKAYDTSVTALRFFNVYGTRQALSNPYTGVLAIFACRFLNNNPPLIYEDGQQRRDFVSVHDVAQACRLALETPEADGQVFNVGSGRSISICELAESMATALGKPHLQPQITQKYRAGDIRHCFADISRARTVLGYEPRVDLQEGIQQLAGWLETQVAEDRVEQANQELAARGLTV